MLTMNESRQLLGELKRKLKPMTPAYIAKQTVDIPRPALFFRESEMYGLNLHNALKPRFVRPPGEQDLSTVFAAMIETYFLDKNLKQPPTQMLKQFMQIDVRDHSNLFPPFMPKNYSSVMYAMGIAMYCAYAAGHQLLYGKDWAIVSMGDHTFGVDKGFSVSEYSACEVQVPPMNWRSFFEWPRESGYTKSKTLASLHARAQSDPLDTHAAQVLIWAADREADVLEAEYFFTNAKSDLAEYAAARLQNLSGPERLTKLRSILVPKVLSQSMFSKAVDDAQVGLMFSDTAQTESLIHRMLCNSGLLINNKKGPTNDYSFNRQGSFG